MNMHSEREARGKPRGQASGSDMDTLLHVEDSRGKAAGSFKKRSAWPLTIAVFLGVVFAVNFTLLYLALSTDDGLAEENYYEKGLMYNSMLRNEKELGWDIELSFDGTPGARPANSVNVRIYDRAGAGLEGAAVKVTLRRPTSDRYDRVFDLANSGAGPSYSGAITIPLPGIWDLRVTAGKDGHEMEKTFRIHV
ncbi:MAG: FixH family protein [Deltaproteobacteria bacterium]|nr:FixH family protein [Deltaproteobacteria bacterium]